MKPYFVKTPNWLKRLYNKQVWDIKTNKKVIYLTFDDGPIPEVTPWVLQELKKYNAKATFFCIGDNVKKYTSIYNAVLTEGHAVGNHTFHHFNAWKTNTDKYIADITKCSEYVSSKLFRPPYGKIKKSQRKLLLEKGYKIIMWDVLSADFDQSISKEKCLQNVLKNTKNGSIIVFHDSKKAFERLAYVLPKVLAHFSTLGFCFNKLN